MSLFKEDKMRHGFLVHEHRTPSCGVVCKTECGETFVFVRAREGKPENMDCPTCEREYWELHDQLGERKITLPSCQFYLVEDADVITTHPKVGIVG